MVASPVFSIVPSSSIECADGRTPVIASAYRSLVEQSEQLSDVKLYRNRREYASLRAIADTNTARGDVLKEALAAAQDGDTIKCFFGGFDIGTATLDLSLGGTGTVHLMGQGEGATALYSSATGGPGVVGPTIVHLGRSNCLVADMSIVPALTNGDYQAAIGCHSSQSAFTNAIVRNLRTYGHSDSLYCNNAAICSGRFINVHATSDFDVILLTGNVNHLLDFYGCKLATQGPNISPTQPGRCRTVRTLAGKLRLYGTDVSVADGGAIDCKALNSNGGPGSDIEMHGGSIRSSNSGAATPYDAFIFPVAGQYGSIRLSNVDHDPAKLGGPVVSFGNGSVMSVGLSLPSLITVSNSPVTGSGTLTGTLATQAAAKVFAGPTSGANSTPAFRSLVDTDTPNLIVGGGLCRLTNPRFVYAPFTTPGAGDHDVYTCPSGKRAIIGRITLYNGNGSNAFYQSKLKSGGVYYPTAVATGLGTVTTTGVVNAANLVLSAGETYAIGVDQSGVNLWPTIIEFDDTCPVRGVKSLALANGDNTIYTCPPGKSAYLLDANLRDAISTGTLFYWNASGGPRTVTWNIVPSAGSPEAGNLLATPTSVANGARGTALACVTLSAGSSINLNTNAATAMQWAWLNVVEI